ncbi:hypothetical protein SAMN05660236_2503 [Ohtaekwangia koreensis]|uniref:Uncharacterized protein n=1 Tax=Ohtaekwangia koreensis TaxID=688867 RepID=A0A1T5KQY6_9BACT|nr:hypothetical protein SAMN05660236_2503 [Ohtaekwangia koreensis]
MIAGKEIYRHILKQYIFNEEFAASLSPGTALQSTLHTIEIMLTNRYRHHKPRKYLRVDLVNPYICAAVDLHYEPDLFNCIFLHFVFRVYPIFFFNFGFLLLLANQLSTHPSGARDACA